MKKTKILIIIALSFIVFLFLIFVYKMSNNKKQEVIENESIQLKEKSEEKPNETNEFNDVNVELVDYNVYDSENFSFKFVIAELRVTSNSSTNISLNHFKTSENIVLNDVNEYISQLEGKQYFLGKKNVVYDLISSDNKYFANIFIPIKNKASKSIDLDVDFIKNKISFDLTKRKSEINELIYKSNDVITDGKSYQMVVSNAYPLSVDEMVETINGKDEPYLLPSTVEVYAFNLEAVSLWGDSIKIESAIYETSTGSKFEALEKNVHYIKSDNIIGKEIKDKDKGSLFFMAYNPKDNPITYKGVLKLKISGSDTPIIVNVDLN